MERPRTKPAQPLADEPVTPRQAATVILVRGGAENVELLLVQRHPDQKFLGGHWVFPGGAVDDSDKGGENDDAHRRAAVRELEEEAAVGGIAPEELVRFSRWITPRGVKYRFDTHFYLAPAPDGAEPVIDGEECVDLRWLSPADALAAYRAGEIKAILPTIKHLEQLEKFATADDLFAETRNREVQPVEPRIAKDDDGAYVLLPGEPGYEEAGDGG